MPSGEMGGSFTIRDVLEITRRKYKTRYKKNKLRDKVKFIKIKSIKYYSKDRPNLPTIKYEVVSRSYPSYGSYLKDKRGRKRKSQRSIAHFYDSTFVFGREGISLDTYLWKSSCGSMRKWVDAPQKLIGTIKRKTMELWKRQASRMFTNKVEQKKWLDTKIRRHKRSAKYVDSGDWNAQVKGINGDFIFRCAYAYRYHNHLEGRNYYGDKPSSLNTKKEVFFTKHQVALLEALLQMGVFK